MRKEWKKRIFACALPAFFSAVLLAGCAKTEPVSADPETERPAAETERAGTVTPAPSEEPLFSLDSFAVEAKEGLYDLLPVLTGEGQILRHAGFTKEGKIRLFFADMRIEDFDLATGIRTVMHEGDAEGDTDYSVEGADPPLLYDYDEGDLILFSPDCVSFERYGVSDRSLNGFRWDGKQILFFDSAAGKLIRASLSEPEEVLFETDYRYQIHHLLSVSEDGRYASLLATDNYTGSSGTILADLMTGSLLGRTGGETYLCFSEKRYATLCRIYNWNEEGNSTRLIFRTADTPDSEEVHEVLYEKEDFYPLVGTVPGGYLIEDRDDGYTLYRADASGQRTVKIEFPAELYTEEASAPFAGMSPSEPEGPETAPEDDADADRSTCAMPETSFRDASDGRYVLTEIRFGEKPAHLLLWDSEQGETFSDPGMTMSEPLFEAVRTARTDYGEFQERVDAIRERYGITVLLGEEADLKFSTHVTTPVKIGENAGRIDAALGILESAFSEYPPGFFQKLAGGETGRIVVELCGIIRAADGSSLDYPSALSRSVGEIRLLAFDLNYLAEMRYTVFHEISHMIDDCLESEAAAEEEPFWSEETWNGLNPEGFAYYNAYNDENGEPYDLTGSSEYTEQDVDYRKKKMTSKVYFIDIYSKTFPTEDRAVLLGTLLSDDSRDELLSCPHILEKLEYYSEAIRSCFDPDGTLWPEPTIWEKRITELKSGAAEKAA